MAVYVDSLMTWGGDDAPKCFRHKPSCHMYADTLAELHVMAIRIGLRREWFQPSRTLSHYDLTAGRRKRAVECGAVEHTREQAINKWVEIRKKKGDDRVWL